ncbi:hypothetical protein BJV74DRAFT_210299 [Russula compacta]|nr:hypothetical protein BJV74DRAFT_210299 [Russula compacta]
MPAGPSLNTLSIFLMILCFRFDCHCEHRPWYTYELHNTITSCPVELPHCEVTLVISQSAHLRLSLTFFAQHPPSRPAQLTTASPHHANPTRLSPLYSRRTTTRQDRSTSQPDQRAQTSSSSPLHLPPPRPQLSRAHQSVPWARRSEHHRRRGAVLGGLAEARRRGRRRRGRSRSRSRGRFR